MYVIFLSICVYRHLECYFEHFIFFLILANLLYFNTFKATPFPNSFKCFTCDNAVDNYNCNRWAEDRWCPESKCVCTKEILYDS